MFDGRSEGRDRFVYLFGPSRHTLERFRVRPGVRVATRRPGLIGDHRVSRLRTGFGELERHHRVAAPDEGWIERSRHEWRMCCDNELHSTLDSEGVHHVAKSRQDLRLPARVQMRLDLVDQHDDLTLRGHPQSVSRSLMLLPSPNEQVRKLHDALDARARVRERDIAVAGAQHGYVADVVDRDAARFLRELRSAGCRATDARAPRRTGDMARPAGAATSRHRR